MTTQLKIERSDWKKIIVTQIDPPRGESFHELSIASHAGEIVVYLAKEDRETLLKALMKPKK